MAYIKENLNSYRETGSALFIIAFVSMFVLANLFGYYSLPLFFLAMAAGGAIAFFYPRAGLAAAVFLTFIFERFFALQPLFIGRNEYKLYPLDIILIAVLASVALHLFISRHSERSEESRNNSAAVLDNGIPQKNRSGGKIKSAGFYLTAFIILSAIYFFISVFVLKNDFGLSFSSLKYYSFYPLLYFAAAYLFGSREKVLWLLKFALAGAVGIIFFIVYGLVSGHGLWSDFTPLSTEGVRTLAFTHAFYLSMTLTAVVIYAVYSREKQSRGHGREQMIVKILSILAAVWIIGIVGSMMRHLWGSLLVVFLAGLFLVPQKLRKKYLRTAAAYAGAALIAIMVFTYLALMFPASTMNDVAARAGEIISRRVESLGSVSTDESFSWRNVVWKEAAGEYLKSPFFGVGFGKKLYTQIESYKDYVEVRNIHNSYLVILVQMGIPALILLGFFAWRIVKEIKANWRGDWMETGFVLVLIGLLVNFMFQPYLETNLLGIFFWLTLGLLRGANFSK